MNLKSSLAAEAGAGAEVDVGAEEVVVVVVHVRVAGSPLRRLPLARLRVRPLGQVLAALGLVLGLQAVLQPLPGPQAVLLPGRWRKVALAQAAVPQGKVLRLHSVQAEQVPMSQAAVPRLARSIISSMFQVPRPVQSQQQAQDEPVALPPIFCRVVLQPSARPQPPVVGQSLQARQSALVRRPSLRALAAQA